MEPQKYCTQNYEPQSFGWDLEGFYYLLTGQAFLSISELKL